LAFPTRRSSDLFDCLGVGGAIDRRVAERRTQVYRVEAFAQSQDLPSVMRPNPRWLHAHHTEKLDGALTHLLECGAKLLKIDRAPSLRARVNAARVDLLSRSSRGELVLRNSPQVGCVDKQLTLGHTDRKEVGDVIVGHRV